MRIYAVYKALFLKSFINAYLRLYNHKLIYSLRVNTDIVLDAYSERSEGIFSKRYP
nr:MAG TPA: hypothetical protein [Caudoviricetes sp.]